MGGSGAIQDVTKAAGLKTNNLTGTGVVLLLPLRGLNGFLCVFKPLLNLSRVVRQAKPLPSDPSHDAIISFPDCLALALAPAYAPRTSSNL
jgi:hypothetical protein